MSEPLKPGNPLRVMCRTCRALALSPCSWTSGQKHPEFHKKRVRDARQDYIANSPPQIVGTRLTRTTRRVQGGRRAKAWREWRESAVRAALGDVPGVERSLSKVSASALDMNTPAFWKSVWSK